MVARRSLRWPVTLGVVMIVLVVTIAVGWVILNAILAVQTPHAAIYWTILAVGAAILLLMLVGTIFYLVLTIKAIRLSQRQSNFIDAVTHELKSPIASLKLYLQTMARRQVSAEQQTDFHRFMLEDLERLDQLIDHLLDAARLEEMPVAAELECVRLDELLADSISVICKRYQVSEGTATLKVEPASVMARRADLEIVFRNLLDNALKYAGEPPEVEVECRPTGKGRVVARISDNGPGVPIPLRRKIFGRFVRLGSELERDSSGTGLGLFIVRTLVGKMGGKVQVHGRGAKRGAVFEVDLPAAKV